MRASYNWLKELSGIDASPEIYAQKLTSAGLEVEGIETFGDSIAGIVVAEVRGKRPHPNRDKLQLVTVFDGDAEEEVVCGAPNVPEAGRRVLYARLGAKLPGLEISERKLGGVVSRGMLCSERELEIGEGEEGIVVLGAEYDSVALGTDIRDALSLRDTIFEIGLTPNRPDGLGHVGLARDLAAVCGERFVTPSVTAPRRLASGAAAFGKQLTVQHAFMGGQDENEATPAFEKPVLVDIKEPARCPRYGAGLAWDVKIKPSPFWLRYRLHCLGLRPINNVVDVTNFILLEWGHPIHAFDLDRVRGSKIEVRLSKAGESMATLDGEARSFSEDDLLICDGEGPVAVAGVMGGANSEIREDTTRVLVECAYFAPRGVRRTSRRLGLHTDSSHRFERGVDPNAVPTVIARALSLLGQQGDAVVATTGLDVHPSPIIPKTIVLRVPRVSALLGVRVSADECASVLARLGCDVADGDASNELEVLVPTWRPDIAREVDLIEEIARVGGYDRIPTEVPSVRPSAEGTSPYVSFLRRAKETAARTGLFEAVNYAFVNAADLKKAKIEDEPVALQNPLSEERGVLRNTLVTGLLHNIGRAMRRQVPSVALFELGRAFLPSSNGPLLDERDVLAVALAGGAPAWLGRPATAQGSVGQGVNYDFFHGKGIIESLVGALGPVELAWALPQEGRAPAFLHPKRVAEILVDGVTVGYLGEVHPDVVDAFELDSRPIYGELHLEVLHERIDQAGVPQAVDLPKFPSVARDVAMLVEEAHSAGAIARALREGAGGLAEYVAIFDEYRGEHVGAGQKSLAFRITYRDPENTLTDKKVDKAHNAAVQKVQKEFAAQIR